MTQFLRPLFGEYIQDATIAHAIALPPGIYAGMDPVISGAGGSAGWTVSLNPDTDGFSYWRTRAAPSTGNFVIQETSPIQVNIAGPGASPRIDLVVGVHKWVAGPTDPSTLEPTGAFTTAQQATYTVVQGTPSATPVDPTVPNPFNVGGTQAVVLARVRIPTSGAPVVERYLATDLRLAYMRSVIAEVETARNTYSTLKDRIDAIGTAQLIEATNFKVATPITGGGNYQPVDLTGGVKTYGTAVSNRSATTLGLTKPGLYEVISVANSALGTTGMLNAMRIILGYNSTTMVVDEINDTIGDDEDQTAYAMIYVDPTWTDPYISILHDSYKGGNLRGSVKYLGNPNSIAPISIITGDQLLSESAVQTWPDSTTISLTAGNPVGAVTWTVVSGLGLQDATTDPKASIVLGALQLDWTVNPGTLPKTWNVNLQATDSATPPRTIQKTIIITLNAYSLASLIITTTAKNFAMTGAGPFAPSFVATATGGTTPYTWTLVAGVDTNLPGAAISGGTLVAGSLTYSQMNAGPYKVRLRCTDSAGTPVQTESVINITTSATSGGGGGGGGCVPAGTEVLMEDGSTLPIEAVTAGMVLSAFDEATMQPMGAPVKETITYEERALHYIESIHGSLICSHDHRIYRDGDWVPTREIQEGDITLWLVNGEITPTMVTGTGPTGETAKVYHFALEHGHIYVAGNVLAHNMKPYGG